MENMLSSLTWNKIYQYMFNVDNIRQSFYYIYIFAKKKQQQKKQTKNKKKGQNSFQFLDKREREKRTTRLTQKRLNRSTTKVENLTIYN